MDEQETTQVNPRPNARFYVTVKQAAEILGTTKQLVTLLVRQGRLRAIRFGTPTHTSFLLVRRDDVQQYARIQKMADRPKPTGGRKKQPRIGDPPAIPWTS